MGKLSERRKQAPTDWLLNDGLDALLSRYKLRFVDSKLFAGTDILALNAETTLGKELGIPDNELWIDKKLRKYQDICALHEAVEHYLRAELGWKYGPSHKLALQYEKEYFGDTELYEEFIEKFGAP